MAAQPISEISEYAIKIGKGENVPDVEINSKDEIGMLANSFNEMKKELAVSEQMRKDICKIKSGNASTEPHIAL